MGIAFPILAYHKIDSRRELGLNSLSPERFERQISVLRNEGYVSISPLEILNSRFPICGFQRSEVKNPGIKSRKLVSITFDDGYEGIYTYAYPILRKYASTAVVFVTTGYIGRRNSWDRSPGPRFRHLDWTHIREMADAGFCFGSHGVSHTFLTQQSDSAARYEIEASKKELEDGLGRSVRFFSYPYGDYDDRIVSFVREAGYEAAFSLRPEFLKAECIDNGALVYKLPRIAIYLVDYMRAFKVKIGCVRGGSLPYVQKLKNRLINRCAYASMLVEKLGVGIKR